jgi:hypothetical protein
MLERREQLYRFDLLLDNIAWVFEHKIAKRWLFSVPPITSKASCVINRTSWAIRTF